MRVKASGENGRLDVVEAPFDVGEQGGARQACGLEGDDIVNEGGGCVVDWKVGE